MRLLTLAVVAVVEAIQKLLLAYPSPLTPRILLLSELAEPLAIQRMWLAMEEILLFLGYLLQVENAVLLYHMVVVPAELVALVVAAAENGTIIMMAVPAVLMVVMARHLLLALAGQEKVKVVQLVNLEKALALFMRAAAAARVRLYARLVAPVAAARPTTTCRPI